MMASSSQTPKPSPPVEHPNPDAARPTPPVEHQNTDAARPSVLRRTLDRLEHLASRWKNLIALTAAFAAVVGVLVAILGPMVYNGPSPDPENGEGRSTNLDQEIANAESLLKQGDLDKAIADFTRVAQLAKNYENKDIEARAWFSIANILQRTNKTTEAIDAFTEVIRLKPDEKTNLTSAHFNRANARVLLGHFNAAIADYDKAIDLDDTLPDAYHNRGSAKAELGRFREAIADYDEAIRLQPNNPIFFENRGTARNSLKHYKTAIRDFNDAIRLQPGYAEAYYKRALARDALGLHEAAIEDYSTVLGLTVDNAAAYYNRVEVYFSRGVAKEKLGQYESAIEDYDRAALLAPEDVQIFNNRGVAKLKVKNFEGAIEDFTKAISLKSDSAQFFTNRAIANANSERDKQAKDDFTTALSLARSGANSNLISWVEQELRKFEEKQEGTKTQTDKPVERYELISVTFEESKKTANPFFPFRAPDGSVPKWKLVDDGADGSSSSANVIPDGNPRTSTYKTLAPTQLRDVDVSSFSNVEIEFWRLSTSNPRPKSVHNCDSSLNLYVSFDRGEWVHAMAYCGNHEDDGNSWIKEKYTFESHGRTSMGIRFVYGIQSTRSRSDEENMSARYLIDQIRIYGSAQ